MQTMHDKMRIQDYVLPAGIPLVLVQAVQDFIDEQDKKPENERTMVYKDDMAAQLMLYDYCNKHGSPGTTFYTGRNSPTIRVARLAWHHDQVALQEMIDAHSSLPGPFALTSASAASAPPGMPVSDRSRIN